MTYATVRGAAEHIARTGTITPHQLAALTAHDQRLTDEQRQAFSEDWRAQGSPAAASPRPLGKLISMAQAVAVFGVEPEQSQLDDLNACLERFSINTPVRIRHFLAQIAHESGGLRWMTELASGEAYENREDLGNTELGDGVKYKGAGAIQITGRNNYQKFADFIGDKNVMLGHTYVSSKYPFTSAGFWWHMNGMNPICDSGASCRQVSARVNGRDPANGLSEREAYYARASAVFPNTKPSKTEKPKSFGNPLQVPHYSQMDSADRSQAARMCFSSSCAMLLQYLKPGTLSGPNGDDQYMKRVRQYGDTTEAPAQVRALSSYGVKSKFIETADWKIIENQINMGVPVPCGYLHRGPVSSPTGGGHWLIVVGYTETHVIVHDPFGEADLINGKTIGGVARFMQYSRKNFGNRWMVKKAADGSYKYAYGHGWAIIAERPL